MLWQRLLGIYTIVISMITLKLGFLDIKYEATLSPIIARPPSGYIHGALIGSQSPDFPQNHFDWHDLCLSLGTASQKFPRLSDGEQFPFGDDKWKEGNTNGKSTEIDRLVESG